MKSDNAKWLPGSGENEFPPLADNWNPNQMQINLLIHPVSAKRAATYEQYSLWLVSKFPFPKEIQIQIKSKMV